MFFFQCFFFNVFFSRSSSSSLVTYARADSSPAATIERVAATTYGLAGAAAGRTTTLLSVQARLHRRGWAPVAEVRLCAFLLALLPGDRLTEPPLTGPGVRPREAHGGGRGGLLDARSCNDAPRPRRAALPPVPLRARGFRVAREGRLGARRFPRHPRRHSCREDRGPPSGGVRGGPSRVRAVDAPDALRARGAAVGGGVR
jgi:hypothetical protein